MVVKPMSPRLSGVKILVPDATGAQYARWRREIKSAFITKGTWGHCDGSVPMPMPEAGPNYFSPVTTTNPQPELLEERRAWVKKDRDVKMDIFLSVHDEVKLEVFETGPPLPPSSMTSKDMLEALDERFGEFKFEEYHHIFCHFLNLHIDQYPTLAEFNAEFTQTLEDLLDHGYPVGNIQACSAYFSKLRCTQNPWVVKKLREWDSISPTPQLADLMKECPPWMIIRPLTTKPSQTSVPESYTEDIMGTPSIKEEDESEAEKSDSTASTASHSRSSSNGSLNNSATSSPLQPTQTKRPSHQRSLSSQSLEITVGASMEDLSNLSAFPVPQQKLPKHPYGIGRTKPRRGSPKPAVVKMSPPLGPPGTPPLNRPLPPIPNASARARSVSPQPLTIKPTTNAESKPLQTPQINTPSSGVHPALRGISTAPPTAQFAKVSLELLRPATPTEANRPSTAHSTSPPRFAPSYAPETEERPKSSRGSPPKPLGFLTARTSPENGGTSWTIRNRPTTPLQRVESTDSSSISLPLQGTSTPEYHDTVMSGTGNQNGVGLGLGVDNSSATPATSTFPKPLSTSPPQLSLMSLKVADLDDDKKNRKRSWSLKSRITPHRFQPVKEMI